VVVFIALRAIMLVSDRSVGAKDETGASFREFFGVKVLLLTLLTLLTLAQLLVPFNQFIIIQSLATGQV
jgi:hypothetical protein